MKFLNDHRAGIEDLADISYMLAFIFVIILVTAMILAQITDVANLSGTSYSGVVTTIASNYNSVVSMMGIAIIVIVALRAILSGFFTGFMGNRGAQ
jgi:flagellar biosynthesis protein FlhB